MWWIDDSRMKLACDAGILKATTHAHAHAHKCIVCVRERERERVVDHLQHPSKVSLFEMS